MNRYNWLDAHLCSKTGCVKDFKAEWGWWRYQVGSRMFAATCQPSGEHPVYQGRELISLKCEPLLALELQKEFPDVVPGFYMDKQHWISVFLDGEVGDDMLRALCDRSYELVFEKLTKKARTEILESAQR